MSPSFGYTVLGFGSGGSAAATGGTIVTSGGYTYHTFTSSGTFKLLQAKTLQYLLVGGGGASGLGGVGSRAITSGFGDSGGFGEVRATTGNFGDGGGN